MPYYAAPHPNLFSAGIVREAYGDRRFNVIDGGSRNELFEPLDAVRDHWNIYAFDADEGAPNYSGEINRLPYGLWSETKTVQLHLAVEPSTSSVYPPNLELFDKLYGPDLGTKVRTTARMVDVPCISVDDAVSRGLMEKPHFFKLDVHSSEYEAVLGARNSLDECVCVLVETWTHPFHKGQKCHGHVEALLNDLGFFIYDIAPVYGYNQSSVYGRTMKGDRKLLTLTEAVFFPERVKPELAVLHVALLDLFRYTNLAVHMCDVYGLPANIKSTLLSFPDQRNFSWKHPEFYKRWIRNIVKAVRFPDRDVTYSGR
jgi:FkbM family methyltransferase